MVRTSILVEVDERVNDLVVVPHKRNKTFSKLMASLLQGYVEDEYVRAYADGTLGDMRRASVDVLDDALSSMTESLSNMGVFGEELKANSQRGIKQFGDYAKEKEEEIQRNSEEMTELKNTVDGLKEQNALILQMLQQMTNGLPQQVQQPTVTMQPTPVHQVETASSFVQSEPVSVEQPVSSSYDEDTDFVAAPTPVAQENPTPNVVEFSKESVKEVEEDVEASAEEANSLLNSLLTGNQWSF